MLGALAIALLAGSFLVALGVVRGARFRPLGLAAPLALAVVVCFEAVLVDALSLVHGVTRELVVAAHLLVFLAAGAFAVARRPLAGLGRVPAMVRRAARSLRPAALALVPALLLVALSAVRFAPNTWDSMTYHLARVAHWIQHASVASYPSHVDRQNFLMPGAEYLLLVLQVVSGTDALASLLQLAAWLLAAGAAPAFARLAGVPGRFAPWAAVLTAALPLALLEASSTQNDLVATVLAFAVIAAALPFVHGRRRWRGGDAWLLAAALAAAFLVKLTALVAAAPFLAVAAASTIRRLARRIDPPRAVVAGLVAIAAVSAGVVGPELVRRVADERVRGRVTQYLYPGVGELPDRAVNVARGLARQAPVPRAFVAAVGIREDAACEPGSVTCGRLVLRANEDYAGNPLHALLFVAAAAVALLRWRHVPPRGRLFLACALGAWVAFHLTFRDNAWVTRLQLPTMALGWTALVALSAVPIARRPRAAGAIALVGIAVAAYGTWVAARHETRPPLAPRAAGHARIADYYVHQPGLRPAHDVALRALAASRCDRLGLWIGGDSFDYPLTWRAMQRGVRVRHVLGEDPWPCLVFAERLPRVPLAALGWTSTEVPFLFGNAAAAPPAASPAGGRDGSRAERP